MKLDIVEDKWKIIGVVVAVGIILLSFLVWSILHPDNNPDYSKVNAEEEGPENQSDILNNLLNKQSRDDILSGKTDKYDWKQNDTEVEISLPIGATVTKKEIEILVTSTKLIMKISGSIHLEGDFYSDIIPSEINWQFDGSGDSRRIEITVQKRVPTERNQHWKCVFVGDEEIGA